MASPAASKRSSNGITIDRRDYHPPSSPRRPLLSSDSEHESSRPSHDTSYAGSFFEHVAEAIMERDRQKIQREALRWLSFVWAIANCLSAGSITAYSLYGHLFQSRLHYSQIQVNVVSIAAELGMYLPVPAFGYLCDRLGPGVPSCLSGILFGLGYFLAAFTYKSGPPSSAGGDGWPFGVMVLAFAGIGMGTSCMYLSAVTTCAKNFGRGNAKGIALAVPIAAFGLSGMWQSQVGSRLLFERNTDGTKGDVDVFRFFIFLAILLICVGGIGTFTLRILDEGEMIDEAVDELERSGLLARDDFFTQAQVTHGYGTMATTDLSDSTFDFLQSEAERLKLKAHEEAKKKTWLLNEETRRYIFDPTMWWLAAGFFLVTGPGEAFINNLGTIIGTLSPPHTSSSTSPATHVSIVALTSTIARLATGTLTDLLAPIAPSHQHRRGPDSVANSLASLPPLSTSRFFTVSRIVFLLAFAFILSLGQLLLASGWVQNHPSRFAVVSALIGAGYGAVFSLTPIVVSVVWGVENFGTNWGILAMTPAAGATLWGAIYATVYQRAGHAGDEHDLGTPKDDILCYGTKCYAPTFWAMAVCVWIACGLWTWAWRGPGGWKRKGIAV